MGDTIMTMKYIVTSDETTLVAMEASIQSAFGFYVSSGCRYTGVYKNTGTGVCMMPYDEFLQANYTPAPFTPTETFPESDFGEGNNIVLVI
jgi:hypothetical protein